MVDYMTMKKTNLRFGSFGGFGNFESFNVPCP